MARVDPPSGSPAPVAPRTRLAFVGGFTKPRDATAHGTHHAAFSLSVALAEVAGYAGIDVYHDAAGTSARAGTLALPPAPPIRVLDQTTLPTTQERYHAIYVANGEQIGPVPHLLRPQHDWAPVVLNIGTTHTAPQWQSLLVALASGSVRRSDGFIYKSRSAQATFRQVWSAWVARFGFEPAFPESGVVIPNGVDVARLQPSPVLRAETRALLRIAADDVVFLAYSRLSPGTKGDQLGLIARWKAVLTRCPGALLLLAGAQVDRAFVLEQRNLARDVGIADRVIVVENPYDIFADARASLMSAADVFVHLTTGLEETSSLVVHEAMAFALPIVASDWAGLREVVTEELGFLVRTHATAVPPGLDACLFGTSDLTVTLAANRTVAIDLEDLLVAAAALTDPARRSVLGAAARRQAQRRDVRAIARAHASYLGAIAHEAERDWPRASAATRFAPLVSLDDALRTQASGHLAAEDQISLCDPGAAVILARGCKPEPAAAIDAALAALSARPAITLGALAVAIRRAAGIDEPPALAFSAASALLVRLLNHGVIARVSPTL